MRAVIDAETNEIVNGNGTAPHQLGLLNVSGTLSRVFPTSGSAVLTPLDCLELAINDLRIGPAYCKADLMAMHPGTFSFLRRQKDQFGHYLLEPDPTAERASSIWGIDVIQNTWIPEGTVILADHTAILAWTRHGLTLEQNYWGDSQWTQNFVSFRAEERVAIGVLRPAAVCVVTSLNGDTSSTQE
jgi:HK97 family phage major capsid protein